MTNIYYDNDQLMVEGLSVVDLAKQYGTPLYIYSKSQIIENWQNIATAFPKEQKHLICYAVKANSNIAILKLLSDLGSGFDIVSLGELERVISIGGNPKKIVFSGVAKSIEEIKRALQLDIKAFNVESRAELTRINQIASKLNCIAPISLRINPNIDAKTHPYISTGLRENKFGIEFTEALEIAKLTKELSNIDLIGIGCHIGSQITTIEPFIDATKAMAELINELKQLDIEIKQLDLGGGLGVAYNEEKVISADSYVDEQLKVLQQFPNLEVIIEPGRSLVANAGILVTEVQYLKYNSNINFAIVNAGMTDLIRPALYQAEMQIKEVKIQNELKLINYDVVGPICETADFLGKNRALKIVEGDLLAVYTAGAYGASMSSNYNSKLLTTEVLVDRNDSYLIRKVGPISALWEYEKLPE